MVVVIMIVITIILITIVKSKPLAKDRRKKSQPHWQKVNKSMFKQMIGNPMSLFATTTANTTLLRSGSSQEIVI